MNKTDKENKIRHFIDRKDRNNKKRNDINESKNLGDAMESTEIVIKNGYDEKDIRKLLVNHDLSEKEQTNHKRIVRVLNMPDLSRMKDHPVELIVNKVIDSPYFKHFDHVEIPEIVSEYETFDLFSFPEEHVARRPSDSYFINKSEKKDESILLRPHTSVMWYYYLLKGPGMEKLNKLGEVTALSWGKVYRVDDLDKTHHECFHQIDGLKLVAKENTIINRETIKSVLIQLIKAIFGDDIEYRINPEKYPYTYDSLEIEVMYDGKRLEVVGAGIVNPTVLTNLGIDPEKYNGRAFGFGIERLAMVMKKVPDIRLFWSNDNRVTSQWGNLETPYHEVSNMPPTYRDISILVPIDKFNISEKEVDKGKINKIKIVDESSLFEIASLVRDISPDLVEEIKIVDIFENEEKLGVGLKSVSIRIAFRSVERTLTNDEINSIYFNIRQRITDSLGYKLR